MVKEYESRETNKKEGTSNGFLLGALIGGLAGAAAALLLAPKTGKEIRKSINSQAGTLLGKTGQFQETVKSKSTEVFTKTKGVVNITKNRPVVDVEDISYIPIGEPSIPAKTELDSNEIRRRIEEAKKALEEEENKVGSKL